MLIFSLVGYTEIIEISFEAKQNEVKIVKKPKVNFIIDSLAFGAFFFLITTGVLMRYILPPGSGHFSTIWGMDRHQWGTIHFWISIVFFSILALHLILHWKWVISIIKGKPQEGSGLRVGLGVIGILTLIAFSIAPLIQQVEVSNSKAGKSNIPSAHQYEDISIKGQMSLLEVERTTNVPVNYLIEKLRLPATLTGEEQLGQLKRTYGIEIDDVRKIVTEYKSKQ